jgi:hypothetical protein
VCASFLHAPPPDSRVLAHTEIEMTTSFTFVLGLITSCMQMVLLALVLALKTATTFSLGTMLKTESVALEHALKLAPKSSLDAAFIVVLKAACKCVPVVALKLAFLLKLELILVDCKACCFGHCLNCHFFCGLSKKDGGHNKSCKATLAATSDEMSGVALIMMHKLVHFLVQVPVVINMLKTVCADMLEITFTTALKATLVALKLDNSKSMPTTMSQATLAVMRADPGIVLELTLAVDLAVKQAVALKSAPLAVINPTMLVVELESVSISILKDQVKPTPKSAMVSSFTHAFVTAFELAPELALTVMIKPGHHQARIVAVYKSTLNSVLNGTFELIPAGCKTHRLNHCFFLRSSRKNGRHDRFREAKPAATSRNLSGVKLTVVQAVMSKSALFAAFNPAMLVELEPVSISILKCAMKPMPKSVLAFPFRPSHSCMRLPPHPSLYWSLHLLLQPSLDTIEP